MLSRKVNSTYKFSEKRLLKTDNEDQQIKSRFGKNVWVWMWFAR